MSQNQIPVGYQGLSMGEESRGRATFERSKKIGYWFRRSDGKDIDLRYEDALEEAAMKRINYMTSEGYTFGELVENIRLPEDPDEGVDFHGWWEFADITKENLLSDTEERVFDTREPAPKTRFFNILAEWNVNDSEAGTWAEVIEVEEGADPAEVAKDMMLLVEGHASRDSINIVDCDEVGNSINAIMNQLPEGVAADIMSDLQSKYSVRPAVTHTDVVRDEVIGLLAYPEGKSFAEISEAVISLGESEGAFTEVRDSEYCDIRKVVAEILESGESEKSWYGWRLTVTNNKEVNGSDGYSYRFTPIANHPSVADWDELPKMHERHAEVATDISRFKQRLSRMSYRQERSSAHASATSNRRRT